MIMFTTTGGTAAMKGFGIFRVKIAAVNVARLPKITSIIPKPPKRFASIQPVNRPGTASIHKYGKRVRASATLICTGPYDIGAKIRTRIQYRLAIIPAITIFRVEISNRPLKDDFIGTGPSWHSNLKSFETTKFLSSTELYTFDPLRSTIVHDFAGESAKLYIY